MASPSLALKQYTPENLPYTRDDLLEAQDVVDEIVVSALAPVALAHEVMYSRWER